MATYAALLDEARKLPDEDRWALGRALLEDLDEQPFWADPEVAEAWRVEIERRIAAIDSGEMEMIEGEVVFQRLFGSPKL